MPHIPRRFRPVGHVVAPPQPEPGPVDNLSLTPQLTLQPKLRLRDFQKNPAQAFRDIFGREAGDGLGSILRQR